MTNVFNNVSKLSEELDILRKKIKEKQASRALIVKDAHKLPAATVDSVLATMSFTASPGLRSRCCRTRASSSSSSPTACICTQPSWPR